MSLVIEETATAQDLSPIVAQALAFTRAYRSHAKAHPAIREAACLETQFPALLTEIRPGDLIAGRRAADRITYVGTIWWAGFFGSRPEKRSAGKQGGYCFDFDALEKHGNSEAEKRVLTELADFWQNEYTWGKVQTRWDERCRTYSRGDGQIVGGGCGVALALDIDRLIKRGIPGLLADVDAKRAELVRAGAETAFVDGLRMAIEVVVDVCQHYQHQAIAMAWSAGTSAEKARLEKIAETLSSLVGRAPATFREGVQLHWIYTLLSGNKHPEASRLDVALGDLLAQDLDAGTISQEEAVELLCSLWRLYNETGDDAVCRIVIGGSGRRNEKNADRFAVLAMEATRRHHRVTPQLTLRTYRGQDPALLKKAFEVIGAGCTYPMLYNDDVVVPGVAKALGVSIEEAQRYHPLGCGEYMLGGCSPSVLTVVWSVPKTVEAVLHNGRTSAGAEMGPETGELASLDTFEKFYAAFRAQAAFAADVGARVYAASLKAYPSESSYLLASLLLDDCLARGKSLFDGGVRYSGTCIMGHGFTNAADALTAIRTLVYEQKRFTLVELVSALNANFEGHPHIRKLLVNAPKFGNDDLAADTMLATMWRDMNVAAREAGARAGLDFLIVSSVNPGGYGMGAACGATADGRLKGEPFAIGHAPTAGADRQGLTALINSVVRVDPVCGGATTNFKLSPEWFAGETPKVQGALAAYFGKGGMHATVTVLNRGDLEAAMREPERYPHLLVRLGGWSARFVDLEKRVQLEILRRTHY